MRTRSFAVLLIVFALFVLPGATGFFTDWLWFGEVGYRPVFLTGMWGRWGTAAAVFVLAFAWIGGHLLYALSAASGVPLSSNRQSHSVLTVSLSPCLPRLRRL